MQGPGYEMIVGWPVYTLDGEKLGDVGEVRRRYFKVNAPLQPDYWLSVDTIQSAHDERVGLALARQDVEGQMLDEPDPESLASGAGAVELLRSDHQRVKILFREFERLDGNRDQKRDVAARVFRELEVHTRLEEEIFYPALRQREIPERRELIDKSFEEHHVADVLVNELKGMDAGDGGFDPKFRVLIETVEHHIQEEERETFPDAEERLGKDLEDLGRQMATRRQQLMSSAS